MKAIPPNRMLAISQKIYACLLVAYPHAHREAYGAAMTQLFRDQSRDAWKESGNWGLAKLWLRVLPDLARTSLLERLLNLNPHKTMADKINGLFRGPSPTSTFFTVATVVFLLILGASIIITLLLPNTYASIARIKVEPDASLAEKNNSEWTPYDPYFLQTTFEIMRSEVLLSNVIASLNLNEQWGKKFYGGTTLTTEQTITMLDHRIVLTPVSNTMLINITAYSDDPKEAAQIANALVDAYRDYRVEFWKNLMLKNLSALQDQYLQDRQKIRQAQAKIDSLRSQTKVGSQISDNPTPPEQAYWNEKKELDQTMDLYKLLSLKIDNTKLDLEISRDSMVQVVDLAWPGRAPVKPNWPVNIVIGAVGGGSLGLIAGTVAMMISFQLRKGNRRNPIPA